MFELVCPCGASITMDFGAEKEDAVWLLSNRFINSHAACGFISPLVEELPMKTKKYDIKLTKDTDS